MLATSACAAAALSCTIARYFQAASPVEEYFLLVDALPEEDGKRELIRTTQPVLDALGQKYWTPCEGTGLFIRQARLAYLLHAQ